MTSTIYDTFNIDTEKYNIILNEDTDTLEQTLQTLCNNYYKSITDYDAVNTDLYLQEIRKYLDLNIPVINQYIEYALLSASNQILKNLIADDIPLYNPPEMKISFRNYNDRQAERIIKDENLSVDDVALIIEHNLEKMDIYCLQLTLNCDINKLQAKPLPPHLQQSSLLNINYVGDNEPVAMAKLFYSMNYRYSEIEL